MRIDGVQRTVVTYGTLIEGMWRMRRPDQALNLLDGMRSFTCNLIVHSLAEAGRFKEALGLVEKFPLYGITPDILTYNSLAKGFLKNGDHVVEVSKMLKTMILREILLTTRTYNYFFLYFARFGMVVEGMNLYDKMVKSGYAADRLTLNKICFFPCLYHNRITRPTTNFLLHSSIFSSHFNL